MIAYSIVLSLCVHVRYTYIACWYIQATCAACDFNTAESNCKRPLKWAWRGDMTPASRSDYEGVKMQVYTTVAVSPARYWRVDNCHHKIVKLSPESFERVEAPNMCMHHFVCSC
jgi:hypothetical protein